MNLAKQFLLENRDRFYDDATLSGAWKDAEKLGSRLSSSTIKFEDGSLLVEDPLTCSVVAYDPPKPDVTLTSEDNLSL